MHSLPADKAYYADENADDKYANLNTMAKDSNGHLEAGLRQEYKKHSQERSFKVDDPVLLSIPTAGKLDPHWEGKWVNVETSDGLWRRIVHINGIRQRIQPAMQPPAGDASPEDNLGVLSVHWQAPQVNHPLCHAKFWSLRGTMLWKTQSRCLAGTHV